MSANSLPRLVRAIACLLIAGAVPVIGSAQPPGPKPDAPAEPQPLALPDLIRLTTEHHPRLAQVAFTIEAARGRAVQEGLYPNPSVSVIGDELGDRTGPGRAASGPALPSARKS
jgi:outer membrane protein, heavy metal efflux system